MTDVKPVRVTSYSPDEYLNLPDKAGTWIIDPLLPTSGNMVIHGEPKTGKSNATLGIMLALDSGSPWLGFTCKQSRIYYLQVDEPRSLWRLTIQHLANQGHRFSDRVRFADKISAVYPFNILNPAHASALRDDVQAHGADVVVIDTLRKGFKGSERDDDVVQQVQAAFSVAVDPAALIYIHHSRKPSQDPMAQVEGISAIRGSGQIGGDADGVIQIFKKEDHRRRVTQGRFKLTGRWIGETELHVKMDKRTHLWEGVSDDELPSM